MLCHGSAAVRVALDDDMARDVRTNETASSHTPRKTSVEGAD